MGQKFFDRLFPDSFAGARWWIEVGGRLVKMQVRWRDGDNAVCPIV
jgi:hypothetical protein